jgi:hypothetical protein
MTMTTSDVQVAAASGTAGDSREKRELLRHTVATLAYRCGKALRDAPPWYANFHASPTSRTPLQILSHVCDLFAWALHLADGEFKWVDHVTGTWDQEVSLFFELLQRFDDRLASDRPLGYTTEVIFQGPVADALTHTGQLTMLRRMAGSPVRGESYARAEISVGRVGADQSSKRVEFD